MSSPRKASQLCIAILAMTLFTRLFAVAPDASDERYLKLAAGAEWTLNLLIIAPDGSERRGTGHRIIHGLVERDRKIYHRSVTSIRPDGLPAQSFEKLVRRDAAGFHSICVFIPEAKEEVEIPLPLKIGLTWETKFPVPTKHTVLAKETLKIGDKEYTDCFKIRSESKDGQIAELFWEAPEVGAVKSEFTQGPLKFRLTLREYKPGKPGPISIK